MKKNRRPKKVPTCISLSLETHRRLQKYVTWVAPRVTQSAIVEQALIAFLDSVPNPVPDDPGERSQAAP